MYEPEEAGPVRIKQARGGISQVNQLRHYAELVRHYQSLGLS